MTKEDAEYHVICSAVLGSTHILSPRSDMREGRLKCIPKIENSDVDCAARHGSPKVKDIVSDVFVEVEWMGCTMWEGASCHCLCLISFSKEHSVVVGISLTRHAGHEHLARTQRPLLKKRIRTMRGFADLLEYVATISLHRLHLIY